MALLYDGKLNISDLWLMKDNIFWQILSDDDNIFHILKRLNNYSINSENNKYINNREKNRKKDFQMLES